MVNLYFTLKVLIPVALICLFLLHLVVAIIKNKLDSKFKKNCFDCKHYNLFDVASCGNSCRYKCTLKDRYDYHNMNNKHKFVKCKEFESKLTDF